MMKLYLFLLNVRLNCFHRLIFLLSFIFSKRDNKFPKFTQFTLEVSRFIFLEKLIPSRTYSRPFLPSYFSFSNAKDRLSIYFGQAVFSRFQIVIDVFLLKNTNQVMAYFLHYRSCTFVRVTSAHEN